MLDPITGGFGHFGKQAGVAADPDGVTGGGNLGGGSSPLDAPAGYPGRPLRRTGLLTGAGFAEQDDPVTQGRHPVLAIGSNADPAQLRRKLGGLLHVPVTAVQVTGLGVGHSAHVSPPGYVPYAPRVAPGVLSAVLLWLDDEALAVLDRTEPNYRRVPFPRAPFEVYRSRWGLLPATPGGPALPAGDQQAAYRSLAARAWFRRLTPELADGWVAAIEALRVDPDRREEIRARLAAEGPVDDEWG